MWLNQCWEITENCYACMFNFSTSVCDVNYATIIIVNYVMKLWEGKQNSQQGNMR
jgi:hypothetical protein